MSCNMLLKSVAFLSVLIGVLACTQPTAMDCEEPSCHDGQKEELFGDGETGAVCSANFQCSQDLGLTCNDDVCRSRSALGRRCDEGDNDDCQPGLACARNLAVPSRSDGVCNSLGIAEQPALYAETIRPGEAQDIQTSMIKLRNIMHQAVEHKRSGDDVPRRAMHTKPHACVKGYFKVLEGLPEDLRVGPVFSHSKDFVSWVRLSNDSMTMVGDGGSKVKGLAVKLVGVDGDRVLQDGSHTQDFVLTNIPAMPVVDGKEFVELAEARFNGFYIIETYLSSHREIAVQAYHLLMSKPQPTSVRTENFWAGGAYRFGNRAMKYSMRPCPGTPSALDKSGDDYLGEEFKSMLSEQNICFDFFVQMQIDATAQPIEDASVAWELPGTSAVRVARLMIPRTDVASPQFAEQEAVCNELSFNPWHSAPEYRPLGHINRTRKAAYEASRAHRGGLQESAVPFPR